MKTKSEVGTKETQEEKQRKRRRRKDGMNAGQEIRKS